MLSDKPPVLIVGKGDNLQNLKSRLWDQLYDRAELFVSLIDLCLNNVALKGWQKKIRNNSIFPG